MATETKLKLFSRREAALLAGVSLKTVDKAIEEKVVKVRRGKVTQLEGDDVIAIALIGNAGLPLQKKTKHEIRRWVHEARPHATSKAQELPLGDLILMRSDERVRDIAKQLQHYGESRERFIESRPEVMGGDPVIAKTRLPVRAVAERIKHGDSIDDLHEDYPDVPHEAFEAALLYARSHPRRGRPARPWRSA